MHIILYPDNTPAEIPEEFLDCLRQDPQAESSFYKLTTSQQKQLTDWVYSAKSETIKVERILVVLDKLLLKK